jgi:uncharacterized protein YjiS (DUF1127 family)
MHPVITHRFTNKLDLAAGTHGKRPIPIARQIAFLRQRRYREQRESIKDRDADDIGVSDREVQKAIGRRQCLFRQRRTLDSSRFEARVTFQRGRRDHRNSRLQTSPHGGDEPRNQGIVGGEKAHVVRGRVFEQKSVMLADADALGGSNDPDSRNAPVFLHDLEASVRGIVVGDENFVSRGSLAQRRFDSRPDEPLRSIAGDADRERGHAASMCIG